ncbi:MAG TPA: hypothetical protein VGN86_17100 [Pyrinomonadaceae bacterium]|nr:hypothetical protein [Pyrinomonadaceae bacterium]
MSSCYLSNHNFLELLALFLGEKRVVRLIVTDSTYPVVQEFCRQYGLTQNHSLRKQAPTVRDTTGDTFTVSVDWNDPRGEYFAVVIALSRYDVQRALELENTDASFRAFGELYQIPRCCVETYEDLERGGEWISTYLRRSSRESYGSVYSNRLGALFDGNTLLPDFFPCRIDCKSAEELGRHYESLLIRVGADVYLKQARTSLSAPIIVHSGSLLQLCESRQNGSLLEFDSDKVCVVCWNSSFPADNIFRQAQAVLISEQRFRLLGNDGFLTDMPVELLNNRVLTFRN